MEWYVKLLGGLRAERNGQVVNRFPTRRVGALLAYLAYYRNTLHPRDILIEMLWPEGEWKAGRRSLTMALSTLRRLLEPPGVKAGSIILADRFSVQLNPEEVLTDIAALEAALQSVEQAGSDRERIACLTTAIDLYTGPLLPGYYETWIIAEQERWIEKLMQASFQLIAHLEAIKDFPRALHYARQAVHLDSLREEAHSHLIRLYAALGQRADAIRQYHHLEHILQQELGAAPAALIRVFVEQLRGDAETDKAVYGMHGIAVRGVEALRPVPQIPLLLTRFFGRDKEITKIEQMLQPQRPGTHAASLLQMHGPAETYRLVNLTGFGGAGKTRIAIECARRLTKPYGNAVWFLSLADLTDPQLIPDTIARALDLPTSAESSRLQQIQEVLAQGPALLILDNFEQLLPEGARFLHKLLDQNPTLSCLVTSRRRLGLSGERAIPILPLPIPQGGDSPQQLMAWDCVRLFVDRAQASRPNFLLTSENATVVADLCQQLEGIPLAIELAAARAHALTPKEMLEQLAHRFAFLVSPYQDVTYRHRTLRATLDWTYQLLSPEIRQLFTRLSIFRGGWDLEALEAICFDRQNSGLAVDALSPLDYMSLLQQNSLVIEEENDGRMRFRLLETLRAYAEELLTPEELMRLQERHVGWYLKLAEQAEAHLFGPEQGTWLNRLEKENDNLRAALEWSKSGESSVENGLWLAGVLWPFWEIRGYMAEGRRHLEDLLSRPGASRYERARAQALHAAGVLALNQADYSAARTFYEECLALRRQWPDRQNLAAALNNLGNVTYQQGDYAAAQDYFEQSLAIKRELGDRWGVATTLNNLGVIAHRLNDYPTAQNLYQQCLDLYREIGDGCRTAYALNNLGNLAQEQSDYTTAVAFHAESLVIRQALGEKRGMAESIESFAALLVAKGDSERAARLYGVSEAFRETISVPLPPGEHDQYAHNVVRIRAALEPDRFTQSWALGRSMCIEQAIQEIRDTFALSDSQGLPIEE